LQTNPLSENMTDRNLRDVNENVLYEYLNLPWQMNLTLNYLNENFVVSFYLEISKTYLCYCLGSISHSCCFHYQNRWCSQVEWRFLNKIHSPIVNDKTSCYTLLWFGSIKVYFDVLTSWFLPSYPIHLLTVEGWKIQFGKWIVCVSLCLICWLLSK